MNREQIQDLLAPLSLEQGLHLLDSLTWFPGTGADRLPRICEYVASRAPDDRAPSPETIAAVLARIERDSSLKSSGAEPAGDGRWAAIPHPKRLYELKYDLKAVLLPDPWFTFMNMGWQPAGQPDPDLARWLPDDQRVWRYSANLYRLAAGDFEGNGRDVLEVGSGRGGGAAFLYRRWAPKSYLAVEQSANNIAFARAVHPAAIGYRLGDAEHLPVPDSSVDAVVNIESAHCYPHPKEFFAEVARVLRPGGSLLFADEWWSEATGDLTAAVAGAGLHIVIDEDITDGIIEALRRLPNIIQPLVEAQTGRQYRIYDRFFGSRVLTESLFSYTSGRFRFKRITAVAR